MTGKKNKRMSTRSCPRQCQCQLLKYRIGLSGTKGVKCHCGFTFSMRHQRIVNRTSIVIVFCFGFLNRKWHYKDEHNIYMLFEYVCGGELFTYLRTAGHFSSSTSKYFSAHSMWNNKVHGA